MPELEYIDQFMNLFKGRTDVYGSVEGKSIKEPVTREHYIAHLEGKKSLGVYPLMDNGEINFFAVDLDEKNFQKALLIRNELLNIGVRMYICESKSKGFHIYGFGDGPLIAKDVRAVLLGLLDKLKISAEVFPKQDQLDEVIKFGNYINLPCFGEKRQFQSSSNQPVPTAQALKLIQRVSRDTILHAKDKVPPPAPIMLPAKPKKDGVLTKKSKVKSPPCVESLLKGVDSGMRDEAAFALARHFLDQGELPEEVLARLIVWDARNKPPIADMRILQTKVESAQHGYAFGCNSITSGLLSNACVGKNACDYLKNQIKEKKKSGEIIEKTYYEDDTAIYEEVAKVNPVSYEVSDAEFMRFDKQTKEISSIKEINLDTGKIIWPTLSEEVGYKAVVLANGIDEYGDTIALVEELKKHIMKYADLPENFREFGAWYILMSYVYNRLPSMCYLRFLGDYGTGKSRSLDVIGGLCYKRMRMGGAITMAPIYRMIKKYEGTLIIDEADFDKSDTTHEVVKILNSGIERGTPIMRCNKDDPDQMQVFPVFGPKAFATRMRFADDALESRCLTAVMEESDRDDIPSYLAKEHHEAEAALTRKLLLWRFRNLTRIPSEISENTDIDLGNIESRLKQVCIPFAMIFKDMPEVLDRFRRFLKNYSRDLRETRMDTVQGRLVHALFKTAITTGKDYVTIGAVAKTALDELKLDIKENTVSRILHTMKINSERRRNGTARGRFIIWDEKLMRRLYRRYLNDLTPVPEEDSDEAKFLEILGFGKISSEE